MLHISVPDTRLLAGNDKQKHVGFNLHCNGVYHATVRYSNLLRMHEALCREWGEEMLPQFPPKKLKRFLNTKQLEQRRTQLNRYLQIVAQSPIAQNHPIITKFFLEAQISSRNACDIKESLSIHFGDGNCQKFTVPICASTSDVTNLILSQLGMDRDYWPKFALLIVRNKSDMENFNIIRWLKDFESPCLSLKMINEAKEMRHSLMIRKSTFESSSESDLLQDKVALKLLYAQAYGDVMNGWCSVQANTLQRLKSFQTEKSFREYVKLCQLQKRYGYIKFGVCTSDYPFPDTRVEVMAGNRSLCLSYPCPNTGELTESVFRVTRIRGWKLLNQKKLVLTFEYLLSRSHFEWITVENEHPVLLCQCLQTMASDILNTKITNPQIDDKAGPSNLGSHSNNASNYKYESLPEVINSTLSLNGHSSKLSMGNGAFDLITDDDL